MIRNFVCFAGLSCLFVIMYGCSNNTSVEAITQKQSAALGKTDSSVFDITYLTGRFEPAKHPDFTAIAAPYASESGMYLRKDTYEAFKNMADAARKEGVSLRIISATRNYARQKQIWEGKWNGTRLVENKNLAQTTPDPTARARKILEYSSMPGTSRHHWGTDIDINNLNNSYFDSGTGAKVYQWLLAHAAEYGFAQPYTNKSADARLGYEEEKWHWSYLPISTPLTRMVQNDFSDTDINGFLGSETAVALRVKNHFMLGINKTCL